MAIQLLKRSRLNHPNHTNRLHKTWFIPNVAEISVCANTRITSGCSKRLSSKAAASEGARRTLRYVEPLSDARTPLADSFSILLEVMMSAVLRVPLLPLIAALIVGVGSETSHHVRAQIAAC